MPESNRRLYLTNRQLSVLVVRATGFDPRVDRIVEVAAWRLGGSFPPRGYHRLVDPGMPILAAATAEHGVTDARVAGAEPFAAIAPGLARFLKRTDLAGFGLHRFALPILAAEFARAGVVSKAGFRATVDLGELDLRCRPRGLDAMALDYLGAGRTVGPGALGAAEAAAAILEAQVVRHEELRQTIPELRAQLDPDGFRGWLVREAGEVVLAEGRHRGRSLAEVARRDPAHLREILDLHPSLRVDLEIRAALDEAAGRSRGIEPDRGAVGVAGPSGAEVV